MTWRRVVLVACAPPHKTACSGGLYAPETTPCSIDWLAYYLASGQHEVHVLCLLLCPTGHRS